MSLLMGHKTILRMGMLISIGGDRNPNIWAYSELYDLFHSVVVVIIKWKAFGTTPSVVIYIVLSITTSQRRIRGRLCVLNEGVTFVARTSDADGKLYVLARVGGRGGVGWSGSRGVGQSTRYR